MNLNNPLKPDFFYHIYNRGINGEDLFKEKRNYSYFLSKYALYMSAVLDTYAYCLLKNHFHFLIKVKEQSALDNFYNNSYKNIAPNQGLHSADFVVSKQFAKLFSCYTQSINRSFKRTGSLVETPFKRIEVNDDSYFTNLIWYIHFNPQKHQFVRDFREYPHSSYHAHLSVKPTQLNRNKVIEWFGDSKSYQDFHNHIPNSAGFNNLVIKF